MSDEARPAFAFSATGKKLAIGALLLLFIGNLLLIFYTGAYGWDDGSITLAYGRTLADHARFSLTSHSEVVEGSSSVLLVFLSAAVVKLLGLDFYRLIAWSQLTALGFTAATIVLLYSYVARFIDDKKDALLVCVATGVMPMFTAEILNGMEMASFAALTFLLVICHERASRLIYWVIPVLLLARYEAVFYLLCSLGLVAIGDKGRRPYAVRLLAYSATVFSMMTLVRYWYFGELMPNTVYAKMRFPYTPESFYQGVRLKVSGLAEFVLVYLAFFIALALSFMANRTRRHWPTDLKCALVVSFGAFALMTGRNWGYAGRMTLACLPIFVAVLVERLAKLDKADVRPTLGVFVADRSKAIVGVTTVVLFGTFVINAPLARQNIVTAQTGGYYQGRYLPQLLREGLDAELRDQTSFGVTPANYRITGVAVDGLRKYLEMETIKFLTADVGGVGLCCDRIDVIDLSLLTNRFLARNGYSRFDYFLEMTNPDVIETEEMWSRDSSIYTSGFFKKTFTPIILNGNFLWLNTRHLSRVLSDAHVITHTAMTIPAGTRYFAQGTPDEDYIRNRFEGVIRQIDIDGTGSTSSPGDARGR